MGAISIRDLGKAYRQYSSQWSRLAEWLSPSGKSHHTPKWVLRGITCDIPAGDAVGIVGANGAGKSTLLKIVTGTTQPTEGHVHVNGRVAALLELGLGFHPDFTGLQNVSMAGQLMGLSRDEVDEAMPGIEAFAGIGDYIDQPVRVYSSGMQMRLAFAVATAVKPDILIVDEALAVGDAAFQRKCFRRIQEFRDAGTTLLFVSHDTEGLKKLCSKALFLEHGKMVAFGDAKTVCDQYERALFGGSSGAAGRLVPKPAPVMDASLLSDCEVAYGDGRATIQSISLEAKPGMSANVFGNEDTILLRYQVEFQEAVAQVVFAFLVKTREGVAVFGTDSAHLGGVRGASFDAGARAEIRFAMANNFAPGTYYINCGIRDDSGEVPVFAHRRVDALVFRVKGSARTHAKVGFVNATTTFECDPCPQQT